MGRHGDIGPSTHAELMRSESQDICLFKLGEKGCASVAWIRLAIRIRECRRHICKNNLHRHTFNSIKTSLWVESQKLSSQVALLLTLYMGIVLNLLLNLTLILQIAAYYKTVEVNKAVAEQKKIKSD